MKKEKHDAYLTVHGHFYQPPRENPWLDDIEEQPSAAPFHNWNERVNYECYTPNSVARIKDNHGRILDIANNYALMSFNFGPTLLRWMALKSPETYQRILEADKISQKRFSGHGSAIAQVYNHIIMPLANHRDKVTQVHWGVKDFETRFKRMPEGIWLAETAVCYDTLNILADYGIKYTILSPFQAERVKNLHDEKWIDVSLGNIDPAKPYRCYLNEERDKYIDIFFYDGSISKAIAFEGVLWNGDNLINRIKDGFNPSRNYSQLIHIGTDGESYGHHTPFGDMALAYALKVRAADVGLKLTNYGEYLEQHPPVDEAIVKDKTAWSCSHGVGRWQLDCGCSTGAQAGWNQQWRKPLRDALDWLNDKLAEVFEIEGKKFFKDPWDARNNYVDILIDSSDSTFDKFFKENGSGTLSKDERVCAIKLLEMQKNAMYMYTSCGWFFADISGIETTQILKYAARAIQFAVEFGYDALEEPFLNILADAKSNINNFGNGREIYKKFVLPAVVTSKQVVAHWAINSLFERYEDVTNIYCYQVVKKDYIKDKKGSSSLVMGRIELTSNLTKETNDLVFALLHFGDDHFHCTIKGFDGSAEYQRVKDDLTTKFSQEHLTEVIRALDEHFGREYYTLKTLFIDKKRKIIRELIKGQLDEFSSLYNKLYEDSQGTMRHLLDLGLDIPSEFKIAAEYTLSRTFNEQILEIEELSDIDNFLEPLSIIKNAESLGVVLKKGDAEEKFSNQLTSMMKDISKEPTVDKIREMEKVIYVAEQLHLKLDTSEAQNIYYGMLKKDITSKIDALPKSKKYDHEKSLISEYFRLGEKLSFALNKYYDLLSKNLITKSAHEKKAEYYK